MKIAVLLSTYNGAKYISQQIESVINQSVSDMVTLYVRDDGSTDNTLSIIASYINQIPIHILNGNTNIGPYESFWMLLNQKTIDADYFAFCDQDDIWDRDKLKCALESLEQEEGPTLWCSNCRLIDSRNLTINERMNINIPRFDIASQIVCGTTQGCAMVFNRQLKEIAVHQRLNRIPMHDLPVIMYAIARGKVIYEESPYFSYRLHTNNVVAKQGKGIIKRATTSLKAWFSKKHINEISDFAFSFMEMNNEYLDEDTKEFICMLQKSRRSLKYRIKVLRNPCVRADNRKALRSFRIRVILGIV